MEIEEKFLPIGTVVLLKGGKKRLMITGYCMKTGENPDKIYDYNGCLFPEGVIKSDLTSVFDHSQIEKVFFKGYKDEESDKFFNKLNKALDKHNNNNNNNNKPQEKLGIEKL